MDERWFQTSSGRHVHLTGVHIRSFDHGYLEGRADLIRKQVLARLPDDAVRYFPGHAGIYVSHCEGADDAYPRMVVICEFHCSKPIEDDADCSTLIVVWFADNLNFTIPEFISARIENIEWEQYAVDGWY
ncbi:hypothetical protein [Rubinisphaera sp.]|uniref:hypothetical protein n=1 Tax=Rubinisphaera sp. TaxID=2024857 RepID=UPI0025F9F749|nr:hypothetical protein [Rubinisphaera sp.]|tara:strand:- start:1455 stop:1844 length:390 start_codon:yes stop_codon:yes gene_type:complete